MTLSLEKHGLRGRIGTNGLFKKKKTSLWQGVTTQGTKGAIITLQRGQKADSALGRRPADILKLPFANANVYVLIAQKEQPRKKIVCRGGSFPAVPAGSCCHVQRQERAPTGPVGSPSRARQEHVVGTTAGGDLWSLLPSRPLPPLPGHKAAAGKGRWGPGGESGTGDAV